MNSSQLEESERKFDYPRKPKRAFDFFWSHKKDEYKDLNLSSQKFTSLVSQKWKQLSVEDRLIFINLHKTEKQIYKKQIQEIEKEINGLDISQNEKNYYLEKLKGKKKDVTAYNCYFQENRRIFAGQYPQASRQEIVNKTAESWRNLHDFEKKQYETLATIINQERAEQVKKIQKQNKDIKSQALKIQNDFFKTYDSIKNLEIREGTTSQDTISIPKFEKEQGKRKRSKIYQKKKDIEMRNNTFKLKMMKLINKSQKELCLSEHKIISKRIKKLKTFNISGEIRKIKKCIAFQMNDEQVSSAIKTEYYNFKTQEDQQTEKSQNSILINLVNQSLTFEEFLLQYSKELSFLSQNQFLKPQISQHLFKQRSAAKQKTNFHF